MTKCPRCDVQVEKELGGRAICSNVMCSQNEFITSYSEDDIEKYSGIFWDFMKELNRICFIPDITIPSRSGENTRQWEIKIEYSDDELIQEMNIISAAKGMNKAIEADGFNSLFNALKPVKVNWNDQNWDDKIWKKDIDGWVEFITPDKGKPEIWMLCNKFLLPELINVVEYVQDEHNVKVHGLKKLFYINDRKERFELFNAKNRILFIDSKRYAEFRQLPMTGDIEKTDILTTLFLRKYFRTEVVNKDAGALIEVK